MVQFLNCAIDHQYLIFLYHFMIHVTGNDKEENKNKGELRGRRLNAMWAHLMQSLFGPQVSFFWFVTCFYQLTKLYCFTF